MSTVHVCLNDIFGVAVAGCEVIFYPGDTPFSNGSAIAVSGARSIRLDAEGNGSVTLLPGRYAVRFSGITGNTDTLLIQVPNDEESYLLPSLICGGNWVLPMRDFLQRSKNLGDVADPAAGFAAIKQAATVEVSGVVQLATQAEVNDGTDAAKVVTPAALKLRLAALPVGSGSAVKMLSVANAAARFALTAAQVNPFDVVEQLDTRAIYQVLDTALLAQETGYVQIGTRTTTESGGGGGSLLDGLSAYWQLDEESGVRADSTANEYNLTDNNSVGFEAGKLDNAASFNGENYLSSNQTFDPTKSYTISCWAKLSSASGYQDAIQIGGDGLFIQLCPFHGNVGGPAFNPCAPESGLVSIADLAGDNQLHFLACSYDASTGIGTLYVDNKKASTTLSTITAPAGPLYIGGVMTNPMTGWVDEVGVWSRALGDDEIAKLYNNGNGMTYPFAS